MKPLKNTTKLLLFTNWLILISFAMLAPIYAIFIKDIWWDLMDASIAWWLFALSAGITSLISWKITDKIKHKSYVVIFWYYIMWIWSALYTLVDSISFLFIVQIIVWLWEAIYSPSFDALYWNNIHKKQQWLEWWTWESMNYFTIAIWSFIWWFLVTYLWFNSIFIIMSILCFLSGTFLLYKTTRKNCKMK